MSAPKPNVGKYDRPTGISSRAIKQPWEKLLTCKPYELLYVLTIIM